MKKVKCTVNSEVKVMVTCWLICFQVLWLQVELLFWPFAWGFILHPDSNSETETVIQVSVHLGGVSDI